MSQETPDLLRIDYTRAGEGGRASLVVRLPGGAVHTDTINVASSKARTTFLDGLCKSYAGLDRAEVDAQLNQIAAELIAARSADEDDESVPSREELNQQRDEEADAALKKMPESARAAAEQMLADPGLVDVILADAEAMGIVGERDLVVTTYMLGTSRLLDCPLAAIVQGPSSTGKTFVPLTLSGLFPPEALFIATDITPNALYYGPPGMLIHRWVIAGERPRRDDDDHAEATRALREMIGSGVLSKAVTMKSADGKSSETKLITRYGPIAFIESTTAARIFDEDANRCLLVGTDESKEQTARIVAAQAKRATGAAPDVSGIVAKHQAAQRMLRRGGVDVPFAEVIADAIPKDRQEARRAMPQIISMIRSVAILHQRQRTPHARQHGDVIVATEQDYAVARRLLAGPLGRAIGGGLPDAVARFGVRLGDRFKDATFTSVDVTTGDKVIRSRGKANEYLRVLEGAGVVECQEPGRGSKPATWKVTGVVPIGGAGWMPTVEEIRACLVGRAA